MSISLRTRRETSRNFFLSLLFLFYSDFLTFQQFFIQTNAIINLSPIINPQIPSTLAHPSYCSQFEFRVQFGTTENVHDVWRPLWHLNGTRFILMMMPLRTFTCRRFMKSVTLWSVWTAGWNPSRWALEVNTSFVLSDIPLMSGNLCWVDKVTFSYVMCDV